MKNWFFALVVFYLSFGGTSLYIDSQSPVTPKSYVHKITGEGGAGSFVMIAPGLALTAAHIAEMSNLVVNKAPVYVLSVNSESDLALLAVAEDCPCAPVALEADVDDAVVVVGYPLGAAKVLTHGAVQDFQEGFMITSAPIAPGNSGGGVFTYQNFRWELVGIISQGAAIPFRPWSPAPAGIITHMNISPTIGRIWSFLLENNIDDPSRN